MHHGASGAWLPGGAAYIIDLAGELSPVSVFTSTIITGKSPPIWIILRIPRAALWKTGSMRRYEDNARYEGNTRAGRKSSVDHEKERLVERRVTHFLAGLLIFVIAIQLAQLIPGVRSTLNTAIRLEGEPLERIVAGVDEPAYPWLDLCDPAEPAGAIYLRLTRRPKGEVWILVNSRPVRMVDGDGGTLTIRHGDFVEILAEGGEVMVLVSSASSNVQFPGAGIWVSGQGRMLLGRVRLR